MIPESEQHKRYGAKQDKTEKFQAAGVSGGLNRFVATVQEMLFYGILEQFSGSELGHLAGRDVDFLACARIASFAGCTIRHLEGAETCEGNGVISAQRVHDDIYRCVKDAFCLSFGRQTGFGTNFFHEFSFGHRYLPGEEFL